MSQSLYHPITLPGLTLPGNLFLAPLAGYTDRAFREICLRYGANLCYTEMVSCEGLIRQNRKTMDLMLPAESEALLAVQIFTGRPEAARESLKALKPLKPALIDLNCGCPVPKVNKAGAGAALMKTPEILGQIVAALRNGLKEEWGEDGENTPVTVKIRSGWDDSSLNFKEAALRAVEAGAAMVGFHPRTRKQGYAGKAAWEMIGELKEILPVPVIASGDLYTPEDAAAVMRQSGCDGVMLARGALGRPFLFREARDYLNSPAAQTGPGQSAPAGQTAEPEALPAALPTEEVRRQKLAAALEHLDLSRHYSGDKKAVKEMKKHICAYTKGISGGSELRNLAVQVKDILDYYSIIKAGLDRDAKTLELLALRLLGKTSGGEGV